MNASDWQLAKELIAVALERPRDEWNALLQSRCSDSGLRSQIAAILRHHSTVVDSTRASRSAPTIDEPPVLLLEPNTNVGPYRILSLLGRGGMGEVYLGADERLKRPVALKAILDTSFSSGEARSSLLREARAAARISHPNVATVYDVVEEGDRAFIVMEYVEGGSLADEIRNGALPLGRAIDIGRQLASAVNAAHTLGVVHRDLKPANVQLSSDGSVKVLDFGLARAAVPKTTGASTSSRAFADGKPLLFGTPGYMSPEHWQKTTVSEAADIYCIGLIVYELVTGRGPEASGEPLDQLLYTGELPSRPDALNPSLPAALAAIVERALQPSPERRWQSAAELETALVRILHAAPGSERFNIKPLSLEFAVTLSRQDWEPLEGAWQCPALGIPGADVVALRPGGVAVNTKSFEVVRDRRLIKWQGGEKTREAVAVIRVAGDLAPSGAYRFWKRLAMGIAAASLLVVTLLFVSYARHARADTERAHNAIVETFARSNDFLTTGPDYSFARLLADTQREAWFIGTTFYISVDQFHDMLLERLQKGIDLHFLILNPDAENVRRVAALLGVTEEELLPQCLAGIRTLRRLDEEARASKAPGVLRVRLISEPVQSRMYLFDPRSERGFTYYIPQINGVNSQALPGFLAANKGAPYPAAYFEGVTRIWNGPTVRDLSEWLAANPKALPNLTNRPQ